MIVALIIIIYISLNACDDGAEETIVAIPTCIYTIDHQIDDNDDISMLGANMRAPFTLVDNIVRSGISVRDSLPLPVDILPQELLEEFLSRLS